MAVSPETPEAEKPKMISGCWYDSWSVAQHMVKVYWADYEGPYLSSWRQADAGGDEKYRADFLKFVYLIMSPLRSF